MKKVGIIAVWLLLIGSGYAQKTMVRVHLRYTADDTFRFSPFMKMETPVSNV